MDALSPLLAAFASAFTQDNRLFSLRFTQAHLDAELLPHTLDGEEHVSAPFRFSVECLSDNALTELKSLLGLGVDIAIALSDGGERVISGIITSARQLGSDGGFARYGLTVEPAIAVLKLRRNSRVFQDKSVVDIVGLILDEHIQKNPVFAQCFRYREQLTATYPSRSFCQQYRESDFAFIERLLREEGISYSFGFEHGASDVGLHTLVLFDSGSSLPASTQSDIRFHRAHATEADDTFTGWTAHRQIRSGSVALASFDYKGVLTQRGADQSRIDYGDVGAGLVGSLEDYDPQSFYYGRDNNELARYATLRQQARDLETQRFTGSGVVRALGAGQWFTLHEHPVHDEDAIADRQFVVLCQTVCARNNLPQGMDSLWSASAETDERARAGYWNRIEAVRKAIPIVSAYAHTEHAKPTARGQQTATVVGPAGEEIFCDQQGRIKIQFHWARAQDHDRDQHGASANRDDFSSCWVRVMMPSAGAQWGSQFIPRIGQEVLIDFIEGDIDRPIVLRAIHNGQQTPPTFQNAGSLPANKTLSGIKSREYKGSRHNEIVFDNTTNEIRVTLSTEHGKTQLHQGYLIHPRSEGKGTPRGEGFELRTDNAGTIRAAQGLLITTEAQPNANGKQLDRESHKTQLQAAHGLSQKLGDTAKSQNADAPTPEPKLDAEHLDHKEPHLLLHGHGGLAITTPQSAVIATGKNLDQVAQRDVNQTAGRRWIHNAGESISLFAVNAQNKIKASIKLLAAKGNILIQAQNNDVEITADKKITITAAKENLTATAGQELLLQSGGGYIRISGGNVEIHCPGTLSMKAKGFVHAGGGAETAAVPTIPVAAFMAPGAFTMPEVAVVAEAAGTTGLGVLASVTAFAAGMLYSPSTGGNKEKISAPDGTIYTKYADETQYTATAQNGTKWTTASPQDDIGYRTWLANGGNGSIQDWVSEGRPSGLEAAPVFSKSNTLISAEKLDAEGHALARHGGPNRVTDSQLEDRVLRGIDPASGTIYDAYNKSADGSPKLHKVGRNATAFTSDAALVKADHAIRSSSQFEKNILAAKSNGELFSDPVELPLESVFGSGYKNEVRGITRLGSKANPTGQISTDFSDGSIKAIYRLEQDGSINLHTLYPNPKP